MSDAPRSASFASLIPYLVAGNEELVGAPTAIQPILDRLEPNVLETANIKIIENVLGAIGDVQVAGNIQKIREKVAAR